MDMECGNFKTVRMHYKFQILQADTKRNVIEIYKKHVI